MTTIRTFAFAGLALFTSVAGASASTGYAEARLPSVDVYSQSEGLYDLPGFNVFGLSGNIEGSQYTVYDKAPHNGFDLHGNGVHPDIGPITD